MDTGAVYRGLGPAARSGRPGGSRAEPAVDGRRPTVPSVNDLEAPALAVEPRLAAWRDHLAERHRAPAPAGR